MAQRMMAVLRTGADAATLARAIAAAALAIALLALAGCGAATPASSPSPVGTSSASPSPAYGALAYETMAQLATDIGARPAGSAGDARARHFVADAFRDLGYAPRYQWFSTAGGVSGPRSANVIAIKPGTSAATAVIGAHFDSAPVANGDPGAVDNASGVGALVEVAARMRHVTTRCTLVFAAFDDEEQLGRGSVTYLHRLGTHHDHLPVAMINLDTIAGGDYLYAYGARGSGRWLLDDVLAGAQSVGAGLRTAVLLDVMLPVKSRDDYALGGDHVVFASFGVPVAGITSAGDLTGVSAGDREQLMKALWPVNTEDDTMARLVRRRGLVRSQLGDVVCVLEGVLPMLRPRPTKVARWPQTSVSPTASPSPTPTG
jgi:hypothetical protein